MSDFEPVMLPVDLHDDRITTALHEAGHAVAYLATGREFDDVVIYPSDDDGPFLGQVRSSSRHPVWDAAVVSMAGPAVDALMVHGSLTPDPAVVDRVLERLDEDQEWHADVEAGIEPAGDTHPGDYIDAGDWAELGLVQALPMVTANWGAVEAVACRLLTPPSSTLTYEEVVALVADPVPADEHSEEWAHLALATINARHTRSLEETTHD